MKKVVTRALDKHNHEREMASILLSALLGEVRPLLTHQSKILHLMCPARCSSHCPSGFPHSPHHKEGLVEQGV